MKVWLSYANKGRGCDEINHDKINEKAMCSTGDQRAATSFADPIYNKRWNRNRKFEAEQKTRPIVPNGNGIFYIYHFIFVAATMRIADAKLEKVGRPPSISWSLFLFFFTRKQESRCGPAFRSIRYVRSWACYHRKRAKRNNDNNNHDK